MNNPVKEAINPEEYLELERASLTKNEFYGGEIFSMSGAGFNHNRITENLSISFGIFLKGKNCQGFSQDFRVYIPQNSLFTYPDFLIACPPFKFYEDGEMDNLLNPLLIIEVLSPSTESYDRGKKFMLYQGIESLREYALINSIKEYGVQRFYKNDQGIWESTFSGQSLNDSVHFQSIGFNLSLGDIYENVPINIF